MKPFSRLPLLVGLAAAIAIVVAIYPRTGDKPTLRLYAGAGLRPAVEKIVAAFKQQTGIVVEPDYGGSGLIMSRARDDRTADLFWPGDEWYVDRLQELGGCVAARAAVASFVPTLIVARGNPRNVKCVADLARPDLRVGLGKADACQIGRVSVRLLEKAGIDPGTVHAQESLTVNELGIWVKMDAIDAAIVWDAIAANLADAVETISIPPEQNVISQVVLARLTGSRHPKTAQRFLSFVAGVQGQRILQDTGYRAMPPTAP